MKKKVLLNYKEPEQEKEKINKDIFKQKEQIINVNTTSKEEKIIKKQSEKFFVGLFVGLMVLLTFFTVVCLIDVFSFAKSLFIDAVTGSINPFPCSSDTTNSIFPFSSIIFIV